MQTYSPDISSKDETSYAPYQFQQKVKMPVEKDQNSMYPFTKLGFNLTAVKEKFEGRKEQLSLFTSYASDDETNHGMELDRPVTPVDEQVKAPPVTFNGLGKLVRRRIVAKPDLEHLTVDDQQSLAAVIMGEVNGIWPVYRQQVADPFMSSEENKELQRRITVHIVTVCEQLFHHYMDKAQVLNKRGVFSGPANMSRLKAQLALDANKFLNVLTIRRYIGEDMRSHGLVLSTSRQALDGTKSSARKKFVPRAHQPPLSYKGLVEVSRPKTQPTSKPVLSIEEEIQEIKNNIPDLDTTKLVSLIDDLHHERATFSRLSEFGDIPKRKRKSKVKVPPTERRTSAEISKEKVLLKRTDSLPGLYKGDLLDELGMEDSGGRKSAMSTTGIGEGAIETNDSRIKRQNIDDSLKPAHQRPEPGTRQYAAEDLQKLVKRSADDTSAGNDEEGLPPLIQAITQSAKHDGKADILKKKLKMLEQQEEEYRKSEQIHIPQPEHPQPATVSSKMPNKMTVRTSDIRVSDRVCLSSLTLDKFSTVYNDLIDEIDATTVKTLDSNLFLGDEITEVYTEIMKTVPTDHLSLENDPMTEPAANRVNLTTAMASSTLNKKQGERVVNQALNKATEPPWGLENPSEWAKGDFFEHIEKCPCCSVPLKTIANIQKHLLLGVGNLLIDPDSARDSHFIFKSDINPKELPNLVANSSPNFTPSFLASPSPFKLDMNEFKKKGLLDDVIPQVETQNGLITSTEQSKPKEAVPTHLQDYMARSYASWLAWWKNTINSDDYMKYLSAQETDYMGVVFHFYNSDDDGEDSGDEDGRATKATKQTRKTLQLNDREQKLEDLKSQKDEYTPGMWNVNTVLMGGLGNEPELEEDEADKVSIIPSSSEITSTNKTLRSKAKVMSRRTPKQSESWDEADDIPGSRTTRTEYRSQTGMSKRTQGTKSIVDQKGKDCVPEEASEQDRLEKVWAMLGMPDAQKLDMAIKYSSDRYHTMLQEAISEWEQASRLILKRESLIAQLESFERSASDPNRFFEKGSRGSSVARLEEAKIRSDLYKRIDSVDVQLRNLLEHIQETFQDCISYQGRPYLDKMKWDRSEMLFWLQEERKQQALDIEARIRNFGSSMNMNTIQLEPITPSPAS